MVAGVMVAAGLALLVAGVWRYGHTRYQAGMAAQQHAQTLAELQAFRAESERLSGLSVALSQRIATLAAVRPKLIERYTHEIRQAPLPAGCFIDAGRLRHLNAALAAANAAIATGESVHPLPFDSDADH